MTKQYVLNSKNKNASVHTTPAAGGSNVSRRVDAAIGTAVCVASGRAKLSTRPFARPRSVETIRDWRRDSEVSVSKASEQIKIEKNRGVVIPFILCD